MSLGTSTVGDLVPGSPSELENLSAGLAGFAGVAAASVERLNSIDTGAWTGDAADEFRAIVGDVPVKLSDAGYAFGQASDAVVTYATVLQTAQSTVSEAIDLYRSGHAQADGWEAQWDFWRWQAAAAEDTGESPPAAPSSTDPGAWERGEAERLVSRAQADVDDAARLAADRLHAAWSLAPDNPGFWSQVGHQLGQFGLGIWDWFAETGEALWSFSTIRLLTDPDGWYDDMNGMAAGIVYGVQHPVEFGKALVNWDMWMDNPARAFGQLIPDVALAVFTAGTATAAKGGLEGATTVACVADHVEDLEDLAHVADLAEDIVDVADLGEDIEDVAQVVDDLEDAADGVENLRDGTATVIDTSGVAPNLDALLQPGGSLIGQARSKPSIRVVQGDLQEAQRLFEELTRGGTVVGDSSFPGVLVRLPDGSTIGLRTYMSRSPGVVANIDVSVSGVAIDEIKFLP